LLTERDVVRLCATYPDLDQVQVSQVVVPGVVLSESEFLDFPDPVAALQMLQRHHTRHLPIVDAEGSLVGLVTEETLTPLLPTALLPTALLPAALLPAVEAGGVSPSPALRIEPSPDQTAEPSPDPTAEQSAQRLRQVQRIAQLGYWELNLQDQTLHWSEEVFEIFEVDSQRFGASYAAFLHWVHPEDRVMVDAAYRQHLSDRQPYNLVHRLQMPDGRIKYVREQCETVCRADGLPLISRGIVQDITQQHVVELQRDRAEASLCQLIEGTAAVTGQEFFPALVGQIAAALDVRYVLVSRAIAEGFQVLAFWADGELRAPPLLAYELVPCCRQSFQTGYCCQPAGVRSRYPDNPLFAELNVESYIGMGLRNAAGEPTGNLCILHDRPLADPDWAQALLSIFAARAGAELERLLTAQALEQLNMELEARVAQRTAELAEREARYRGLLESAVDAILVADLDGNLLEGNPQAEKLLGYNQAELKQLHFTRLHPAAELAKIQQGFGHDVTETVVLCKDGTTKPVEITSGRFTFQGKTLVQGIFRDISDRKMAEQSLQAENAFRHLILENLAEGLCVCHAIPDYPFVRFTVWNPQMIAMTGYTQTEINQLGWYQTLYPDPEVRARAIARMEAMRQGDHIQSEEWTIRHRDGGDRRLAITTSLLQTAAGDRNVLAVMQDVTERRHTEQERQILLQELAGFKCGLDLATIVTMTDAQGVITYVNQKFVEITGYSAAELLGQTHRLVNSGVHPRSFFRDLWRTIRQGEVWRGEVCNRAKDGRMHWVDSTIVPFLNAQGKPERYLAIRLDITEQKQARLALQESQQFLHTVLDTVPLRVFWKDRSLRYLGANARFLKDAAFSSEADLVGKSDFDLPWAETEAATYCAHDRQIMDSGNAQLNVLETQHLQDGTEVWVETNKLPLRNVAGEVIGILGTYEDITARRETEVALRRQLAAIEAAINGIAIIQHGRFLYLNPAHVQMFGYERAEELIGRSWRTLHSAEALKCFDQEIVPRLHAQKSWQGEVVATRKDGTTFPEQLSLTYVAEDLLIGVCQDISDRKAAEQALQASEALFRHVFESNAVGMILTDFSGQVTDANDRFLEIIGYSRADLNANRINWAKITPPEYFEIDQWAMDHLRRHGQIQPFEKEYLRADGRRVPVLIGVAWLSAQEGRCVCVVVDISDRKRAEQERQTSQAKFQRLVDDIGDKFLIFSHTNTIFSYLSGGFESIFGIPPEAILGKSWLTEIDWFPESRAAMESQLRIMQETGGQSQELELSFTRPDGDVRILHVLHHPVWAETGQLLAIEGLAEDITEQKAAEAELRRTNAELERATRLKDEFLANMSHELRTPLNAILGMTEGLQEEVFGDINEKQRKALHTVENSATHLLSLINDILDVAKIESGKINLEYGSVAVEQLCSSSMAFVKRQALKKGIRLSTQISPHLPRLQIDEIRIRQVLLNLLTNAVKFTREGGTVTLSVSMIPPAQNSGQSALIRFAIADTGIGIAPENIAKLFKPFVQIDSALNRKYTGTGLGLALVKQIVELHGGQVGLTSELGVGSCFMIDLPYQPLPSSTLDSSQPWDSPDLALERSAIAPASTPTLSQTKTAAPTQSPLVLLAEDNPANLASMSSYLTAKGYHLVCAKDGQEALDLARARHPDVILMDIQMPNMDGLEAITQIRQQECCQKIPIIAITALTMKGDRERCLAAGADDYLSKPIRLKQLDLTIKDLLKNRVFSA
jgi:PAS domain S-box-containing protein